MYSDMESQIKGGSEFIVHKAQAQHYLNITSPNNMEYLRKQSSESFSALLV
jgi:hypothetical protein